MIARSHHVGIEDLQENLHEDRTGECAGITAQDDQRIVNEVSITEDSTSVLLLRGVLFLRLCALVDFLIRLSQTIHCEQSNFGTLRTEEFLP